MEKEEDIIIIEGYVEDQLPGGKFRVTLNRESVIKALGSAPEGTLAAVAHISGRIRKHRVRVLRGDRVTMEVSKYSLDRGRIVKRL
ncbi:MAG: translation initiation factor IF-1 [Alphaproteobacteria bacterium]|nr:translation initiation factor IF-1 [Alphaproteobacteria bacterium]